MNTSESTSIFPATPFLPLSRETLRKVEARHLLAAVFRTATAITEAPNAADLMVNSDPLTAVAKEASVDVVDVDADVVPLVIESSRTDDIIHD